MYVGTVNCMCSLLSDELAELAAMVAAAHYQFHINSYQRHELQFCVFIFSGFLPLLSTAKRDCVWALRILCVDECREQFKETITINSETFNDDKCLPSNCNFTNLIESHFFLSFISFYYSHIFALCSANQIPKNAKSRILIGCYLLTRESAFVFFSPRN